MLEAAVVVIRNSFHTAPLYSPIVIPLTAALASALAPGVTETLLTVPSVSSTLNVQVFPFSGYAAGDHSIRCTNTPLSAMLPLLTAHVPELSSHMSSPYAPAVNALIPRWLTERRKSQLMSRLRPKFLLRIYLRQTWIPSV